MSDTPEPLPDPATVPSDHPDSPHPAVSDDPLRIGDYLVVKKLGEGGMGAVYLAEDTRLGRRVAIKMVKREFAANPVYRDRFEREARAAAAVEHDHIVPIWQVGQSADGLLFIAMPFLQGESLDVRLDRVPVAGVGLILKVAREVASGLAAAHAKGLIHRDIKPANIWLEGDLSAPSLAEQIRRCKILDFGLARSVGTDDVQITAPGQTPGTPAFMSPEQARGQVVDPRADLFSLGVTLYRMAAGTLPFNGSSPMAVLIALTTETPPPVRTLAAHLPPALGDLIDRLIRRDPAGRPQSAAEVAATARQIARDLQTTETRATDPPVRLPVLPANAPAAVSISESVPRLLSAAEEPTDPEDATILPEPLELPEPAAPPAKRSWLPWAIAGVCLLALVPLGLWQAGAFRGTKAEGEVTKTEPPPAEPAKKEPPKTGQPKVEPPKQVQPKQELVGDPDRAAALFVLSRGGQVSVNVGDEDVRADKVEELPKEPFQLHRVAFPENTRVTDADLAVFKNCRHVRLLGIPGPAVSDEGLAHFAGCKSLTYLYLEGAGISPKGLAALRDCTEMQELNLNHTKADDTTLADIKRFTKLTHLYINGTKVTAAGVADLARTIRGEIGWDGGLVPCTTEADRKAAEWVLSAGGTVQIDKPGNEVKSVKALPKGEFTLIDISMTAKVQDAELAALTRCKNLTRVYLVGTGITSTGLAHLQDCTNLTELYLSGTKVDKDAVPVLKRFTKLTYLSVGETELGEKDVKELAKALPACVIQHNGGTLEVGSEADRKAAQYVFSVKGRLSVNYEERDLTAEKDLPKGPFRLTHVFFGSNQQVTDKGLENFRDCKNLDGIELYGSENVTNEGLANFRGCKNLKMLNLSYTKITDAGLAHLKDCQNLTAISLTRTKVGDDGLVHLKDCKNLTSVDLSDTQVGDRGLSHLKDCANLLLLDLSGTQVSDKGLAYFKDCKKLRSLSLFATKVTDKGLANFNGSNTLYVLHLSRTQVTDDGLAYFKQNTDMTSLGLSGTMVTDDGLAHLKDCKDITRLTLAETQIGDKGLAHFKNCRNLEELSLANTKVTEASVEQLRQFTKLTTLDLRKTKLTEKDVNEIVKALPRCTIEWDKGTIVPKK